MQLLEWNYFSKNGRDCAGWSSTRDCGSLNPGSNPGLGPQYTLNTMSVNTSYYVNLAFRLDTAQNAKYEKSYSSSRYMQLNSGVAFRVRFSRLIGET